MAKQKVLYTIDTRGTGGAETVFLSILKSIDKEKYEPFIVVGGKGWLYDEIVKIGLKPEIVSMRGSFNLSYLQQLICIVKRKKINIIHAHLLGSNVYCSLVGILCRVPVISTFHGVIDYDIKDKYLKMKFSLINAGSSKIVFVSDYLKEHFIKSVNIKKRKTITIYNGIDTNRVSKKNNAELHTEFGYNNDDILVGSIGNIRSAKGYDILLHAATIIIKKYPKCRFIIAGEGNGNVFEDIIHLRDRLELKEYVRFLGFRTDIAYILSAIDVFVLPSRTEGFSLATIEAMAAGKVVIATDSGGPGEIITHSRDGLLVKPGSSEAIAEAIIKCLTDGKMCADLVSNAQEKIKSKFSLQTMIAKYQELYEEVVKV